MEVEEKSETNKEKNDDLGDFQNDIDQQVDIIGDYLKSKKFDS